MYKQVTKLKNDFNFPNTSSSDLFKPGPLNTRLSVINLYLMAEAGQDEERRLSGLRAEKDELTKELHSTRRIVSVDFRNREEMGLRKLAAEAHNVEKVKIGS